MVCFYMLVHNLKTFAKRSSLLQAEEHVATPAGGPGGRAALLTHKSPRRPAGRCALLPESRLRPGGPGPRSSSLWRGTRFPGCRALSPLPPGGGRPQSFYPRTWAPELRDPNACRTPLSVTSSPLRSRGGKASLAAQTEPDC